MAITRSQVARQLLAEGGAPRRARFANGSFPLEGYGIGTYNADGTLIQTGYAPGGIASYNTPEEAAAMGIFPIRKEDQDLISLTGSGLLNQAAITRSQGAAQAESALDVLRQSMPQTQTTPTPTPQFSDPRMQAAADKGIDPRMGRTLEENIKSLADPRMTGQKMDAPEKRASGFFGALKSSMTPNFSPGQRKPVLDPVPTNDPFKSNLGAPMTPGLSERDLLPGIPGARSLAEEDAIRRRVLASQMNESGRTFADGKYANEAEAIADLGLERYNQLFNKGGIATLEDAKENAPPGEFLAYINPKEADMLRAAGGSGIMTAMGIPSFAEDYGSFDAYGGMDSGPSPSVESGEDQEDDVARMEAAMNINQPPGSLSDEDAKALSYVNFNRPMITSGRSFNIPNVFGAVGDAFSAAGRKASISYLKNELDRRKNYGDTLSGKLGFKPNETPFDTSKYTTRTEELEDALARALAGENVTATIQGNPNKRSDSDGDNEFMPTLFRQNLVPEPATTEPEKTGIEKVLADADEFRFLLPERFKLEDGGIVPRQAYGLGSIVKSVTRPVKKAVKKTARAVKKIAKSDLGKAALAAAAIYFAPQIAGRLPAAKNPASFLGQLQSGNRLAALKTLLPGGVSPTGETSGITKLIQSLGGTSVAGGIDADVNQALAKTLTKEAAKSSLLRDLALISVPSIAAGIMAKKEEGDEDLDALIAKSRKDESGLPELLAQFDDFRFVVPEDYRQSAAEGGMMDLGGNEMDLRGGGFVPIGREEKADDVPARLSKNEFVFTADAVRAAGGGSVDKGADLMYKTMKQLENKVA